MRVRVVQCLCPSRHALMAMAAQPDSTVTDDEVCELLKCAIGEMLNGRGADLQLPPRIDPWCGLCGAAEPTWDCEIGWTREFADWNEAHREP